MKVTAFCLCTSSAEAAKSTLAVETLTSEAAALTAALTMEHISKDISKNISHIAHVTIFEMVFMIAAASLTEAAKSAAKATLAMEARLPCFFGRTNCMYTIRT